MKKTNATNNHIIGLLAEAWAQIVHLFYQRTVWVLGVLFAAGVASLFLYQDMIQSRVLESALLHDAARYSRAITEFRTLYTAKVVEVVRPHGIEVTHDVEGKDNAIPLPATLSIELGNLITEKESGSHVRLYSPYPFPWRSETGGLQDDFAQDAWNFFQQNPDTTFFRFEEIKGRASLRFATADLMRPSCVNCHNTHPESPKTDWKVQEVRGVLEVAIPIDTFIAERRSGLRRTLFLIGGMILLGLSTLAVVKSRLRREEKQLLYQEEKYRTIFEESKEVIYISTQAGNFLDINQAGLDLFGYSKKEIFEIKVEDFYVNPDDREIFKREIEKNGSVRDFEIKFKKKDGTVLDCIEFSTVRKSLKGEVLGYQGIIQDITARKQAEEDIRILSEFPEKNPNPVFKLNRNGDILYYNNGVLNYVDSAENIKKLLPNDYLKVVVETLDSGVSKEIVHSYNRQYISYLFHPITEEIVHVYGLDITERKQAEEALKQEHNLLTQTHKDLKKAHEQENVLREQLVNAERLASLGQMAAKIAHEINNPLTVIRGQAEIQLLTTEDQTMKSSLRLIVDKSTEVAELTRRYMDLGKPQEIKMTSILLGEVVGKTVISLKSIGILKNVKINENYAKSEPHILGDESMLEQVFRNLIINAIQASSEVASSEIFVGTNVTKNKKAVTAYISDKGVGIKKENIGKIFEHYYTTKEDGTGTGLGLPISKEITEVFHGGEISIESTPGKGTVFNVTIPIDKYAFRRRKILLVDDEAYITETFGEYLSSKGFRIRKAQNGKDALKIYSEFEPDLILSDFNMPEMDGIKLFKAVRKIKPDQLFVMITGAFLVPDDLKMLSDNKIPQIIKPADLEKELLKTVRELLEEMS